MLRAHVILPWVLCTGLLAASAQAQVVRCQDPRTGQVTYTDGECSGGDKAREVQARKSAEELAQERAQAAEALERKQQRLELEKTRQEAETARLQAQRQRELLERPPAPRPNYAQSPQCQASRRQWQTLNEAQTREPMVLQPGLEAAQRQMDLDCLGPEGYAEVEKARAGRQMQAPSVVVVPPRYPVYTRPAPPPPPRRITHCNVFRCYDSQGNSYPR